jgi:hypothetical protein
MGETAEVKADIKPETQIVIDGNRLTSQGASITIIQ